MDVVGVLLFVCICWVARKQYLEKVILRLSYAGFLNVCSLKPTDSIVYIFHSEVFPTWAALSFLTFRSECDDRSHRTLFVPHGFKQWWSEVSEKSFMYPSSPPLKCCLCVFSVCCRSRLPEQVVQALLSDRHGQGLRREIWSSGGPRRPGINKPVLLFWAAETKMLHFTFWVWHRDINISLLALSR